MERMCCTALWKIGASHRCAKEGVPGKNYILIREIIAAATHRMSRCMEYTDMKTGKVDLLLILQKYIRMIGLLYTFPAA